MIKSVGLVLGMKNEALLVGWLVVFAANGHSKYLFSRLRSFRSFDIIGILESAVYV
jgi:hypothetical protein